MVVVFKTNIQSKMKTATMIPCSHISKREIKDFVNLFVLSYYQILGDLMAKPKQLINTQNLDLKHTREWSATFYNFASFTKKISIPCMFSITL